MARIVSYNVLLLLAFCALGKRMIPTASFTITGDFCVGSELSFTNNSSTTADPIILNSWDFGDGGSATSNSPTHTYTVPGTYTVKLLVLDASGDSDEVNQIITIDPLPQVDFNFGTDQCMSTTQSFTNLSSIPSNDLTYSWDFGDGAGTSTQENPDYDYSTTGTFLVTLTATSTSTGCNQSVSKSITIQPDPIADFSFSDVCDGESVTFKNLSTVSAGNLSYAWQFGNGDNSTLENPDYTYASAGIYDVTLTVTTNAGCTAMLTQTVTVAEQPQASFTFGAVCQGDAVSFTNQSTLATVYEWDFDDGNTSSDENPTHTYEFSGIYEVTLTSSNAAGCSDTFTAFVEVSPIPVASFTSEDICFGDIAVFNNLSPISDASQTYAWDFDDGGASTALSPTHVYTVAGVYDVALTVTSGNSCTDTFTETIEVFDPSVGGTVAGGTTLCEDDTDSHQLSVSGFTGEIIRWESSITGVDQWISIENTSSTLDFSSLSQTTYYRAIVKNGECTETASTTAQVTIDELAIGGTLSGSTAICANGNSGQLELSGYSGNIDRWLFSITSAAGPWQVINNTSAVYDYTNLTETTFFRAVVSSGTCDNDTSSVATIQIDDVTNPGVLSSNATVCSGNNAGILTLNGFTGNILNWESAANNSGPWTSIDVQNSTLDYEDLTFSTYFRVVLQNGNCPEVLSNEVLITVDEPTVAGQISGDNNVCQNNNTGTLMLQSNVGQVLRWQSSEDEVIWTDISNTTTSLTFSNLTDTTYYRAEVQNGTCAALFTSSYQVNANANPVAVFAATEVCQGEGTVFTNSSQIAGNQTLSYSWDFDDGNGAILENPTRIFEAAGLYNVTLTVTSSLGCVDAVTNVVTVNENPVPSFSQTNVCLGQDMIFVNNSTPDVANVASYDWDFGDGNSSTDEDPTHMYTSVGTFEVSLTVETTAGCSATFQKEVTVDPNPTVAFSFENVCDGTEADFVNHSSVTNGNLFYTWRFGDGNTSTDQNPSHLYGADGDYTVVLTAVTSNGCSVNESQQLTVYSQPVASFEVEEECMDSTVTFNNTSVGTGLSYDWELGDGSTSTEEHPELEYDIAALYSVALTVTTADGCTDTYAETLRIHPQPIVNFVTENVCDTVTASFSNLSSISTGTLTYDWDFGDGQESSEVSPTHKYDTEGLYEVTLTGISDFGCETENVQQITVYPRPEANFTFEEVCDGTPNLFQNTSTIASGTIEAFLWQFGDQTSAIVENPEKLYLNDGSYEVSLIVTSEFECSNEVIQQVEVFEVPVANFEVDNTCFGEAAQLVNSSILNSGTLAFDWDFGDENTSTLANPSHTYGLPGVYTISLVASTADGCDDTLEKDIQVFSPPVITVSNDTTVSQGFPAQLMATGGVSYVWSPLDGLDFSNIADPLASPLEETTYSVVVTDQYGCQGTDSVTVFVDEDFRIVASNVLTPDGNGKNDFWVIQNVETFSTVNVRVYDRYGTLVFQDEAYDNDWGGTDGNDILPDGTYYYFITFSDAPTQYSGALTILRNR